MVRALKVRALVALAPPPTYVRCPQPWAEVLPPTPTLRTGPAVGALERPVLLDAASRVLAFEPTLRPPMQAGLRPRDGGSPQNGGLELRREEGGAPTPATVVGAVLPPAVGAPPLGIPVRTPLRLVAFSVVVADSSLISS